MPDNPFEIEHIESMLRKMPEREAPSRICGQVMNDILARDNSSDSLGKLRNLGVRILSYHPFLLRTGAVTAMVAAAFWIGLEIGNQGGKEKTFFLSEEFDQAVSAGKFHTSYRFGTELIEERETDLALDFFPLAIPHPTPSEGENRPATDIWPADNSARDQQDSQQSSSRKADSVLFLLNLAHNLADSGNYQGALYQYEKALRINPQEQTALFNRAICLNRINDVKNEQQAFTSYLEQYRTGRWAIEAVGYLQTLGVFDYQIGIIGNRKVVVNQKILLDSQEDARHKELERLATYLLQHPAIELHLVVFCQDDLQQGKSLATRLKRQIHTLIGNSQEITILSSWFDEPALIQTAEGTQHKLEKGLFVFTQPSTQQRSRI
jgi:tetratricopeptide (TPR) repeat protein